MPESPFAVLTAVVAPAILTNACSVLCLGTGNRLARVVDRTRAIQEGLKSIQSGTAEHRVEVSQLERQEVRAGLLLRAMRHFYACLGAFASTALLAIAGTAWGSYDQGIIFRATEIAALVTGSFGVLSLVSGCVLMVRENRLAVENLTEEVQAARARYAPGSATRSE